MIYYLSLVSNTDECDNIEEGNHNDLLMPCISYFDLFSNYYISSNIANYIQNILILCG